MSIGLCGGIVGLFCGYRALLMGIQGSVAEMLIIDCSTAEMLLI